jgi:hypothetical protein
MKNIASVPLALLFSFLTIGCTVDKEAFYSRLFSCNPNAADPACGTDVNGAPMSCVAAYQLGGGNFCATGCDRTTAPTDGSGDSVCLASGDPKAGRLSGAALKKCSPDSASTCGHEELSCLRTDLLENEGVCMNVTPCEQSADCHDPVRATCMGELVRNLYDKAQARMKSDHTYCLQGGCNRTNAACSPGESCLQKLIGRESAPPDICVPNCDSNQNCPPNYFCYRDLYSKPSPAICLPGLMGLRCRTRLDCLFGDCVDTGAGFNVCAIQCEDDTDCGTFDSSQGTFFCSDKGADGKKHCSSIRAFRGSECYKKEDCREKEVCSRPIFRTDPAPYGQCLIECNSDGTCPAFGGVAHACLPQTDPMAHPICWPGHIGIPCRVDSACIKGLSCRPTIPGKPNICTAICLSDDDCAKNPGAKDFLSHNAWCHPDLKLCQPPVKEGGACDRNAQCESSMCLPTTMKCAPLPPV